MHIAHFSDLHVLSLEGVGAMRFMNKRLSGLANLRFKRQHAHRTSYVRAVAKEIARVRADHVVVTGDLTNLALEQEFLAARTLLEEELHLTPDHVSIVPGNHDFYTRGALRGRRFTEYFRQYVKCDLDVAVDIGSGHFPFVRLRGPCAFIGLSSAVPRVPFVAAGVLGKPQLAALRRALAHPEVRKRLPVLLVHHPLHNPPSRLKAYVEGLRDADALIDALRDVPRGLVLHGHLHDRVWRSLKTTTGEVFAIGATSASLHHETETRMSGFNLYDIDDATGAIANVEAHVFDPAAETFHIERIAQR